MVEWCHELLDLVPTSGILHDFRPVRVEVIGPDEDFLLACRDGKRAHACHDIADHLAGMEFLHESSVFGFQTAVPVYTRVVEAEFAVLFVVDDVEIVVAC